MNATERALVTLLIIAIILVTIAACLFAVGYRPAGGIGSW